MTLPPLPPEHARSPDMLAWRLDVQQTQLDGLDDRISTLESRPSSSGSGAPPWSRYLLAGALLLAGATGHAPEAATIALRLLGL